MKSALFDQRHGPGSYAELLSLLGRDCNSLADVGRRFGLTRARVQQIYKELFPPRPRFDRRRSCSVAHSRPIKPFGEAVMKVWREARRLGLDVEKVSKLYSLRECYWNRLRIEGKLCVIYNPRRMFVSRKGHHATYIELTPKVPADFYVLVTERGDYVFPAEILKLLGKTIYVPAHDLPVYRNIRPKTDWSRYKDAWYLLKRREI